MEIDTNLIIDVGAYNGDTLDKYLNNNFNIVAVECHPDYINILKTKYQDKIKLFECCITNKDNDIITFYTSKQTTWSSVNKDISTRFLTKTNEVQVKTRTLDSIIKEISRIPYYCKIDIEGNDFIAIESLDKNNLPKYISCESECIGHDVYTHEQIIRDIRFKNLALLHSKGYNKFCLQLNGGIVKNFCLLDKTFL